MLLREIILSGLRLLIVTPFFVLAACDWVDDRPDINDKPVVFDDGPYKVLEGNKVVVLADIGPLANDRDGGNQGITAVLVKGPRFAAEGGFQLHADGSFVYVHDGSENHEDYFVYMANDGLDNSEHLNVQIIINPVNDPPVITGQQKVELVEDSVLLLGARVLNLSDPDNVFPDDFSLVIADGENYFRNGNSIIPRENYFGPLEIPIVVNDGTDSSGSFNLAVTVTPVNDAPVITGWNQSLLAGNEDMRLAVTLEALDVYDVEGDPVTLQVQPGNGYIVNGNVITAAPDWFGELAVNVEVSDGQASSPGKITVIIEPVNDPPWAKQDNATTPEDSSVSIDVTRNDADPEGYVEIDKGTVAIGKQPAYGTVSVSDDGVVTYRPEGNFNGSDSFGYTVADIHGAVSREAAVTITVTPVNDAPVANNDRVSTREDTTKNINVTSNDSDPDGVGDIDRASVEIRTRPMHGTATPRSNGTVDYSPNADFYGKDQFTYQIKDRSGETSNVATVNIEVEGVNDLPYADDDTAFTKEDNSVIIRVTEGDTDADGKIDRGSVTIVRQPSHGRAEVRSRGRVIYTPATNFHGSDSFAYRVRDDDGGLSNRATVTVTVRSINDAPEIIGQRPLDMPEESSLAVTLGDLQVTDPDNEYPSGFSLTVQIGKNYTLSGNTITPKRNFSGKLTVPVRVNDGTADSNIYDLRVSVIEVNDVPTISGVPLTRVYENQHYSFVPVATDRDAGDTLVFSIQNKPEWASFNAVTGVFAGIPRNKDVGTVSGIVISVRDGSKAEAALPAFDISVVNVNDNPVIEGKPGTVVAEGEIYNFLPKASDPDGDELTYRIENRPAWAAFDPAAGRLSGTPGNDDVGITRGVIISVDDGNGGTAALPPFDLSVTNVNDPPLISGVPATEATEGESYGFTPTASDPDGDELTYRIENRPAWAAFDPATGRLSGTPGNDDVGITRGVVISVDDGNGGTAALPPFGLSVTNVNYPPVANPDHGGPITGNTLVNINVVANDTDLDGNDDIRKDSIVITSKPEKGKVTPKADGTVDYLADDDAIGLDSFKYTIRDGAGETSDEAIVTVTITGDLEAATVNEPPRTSEFCSMMPVNTPVEGALPATDPDGNDAELRYYVKKQGGKGSVWLSVDGRFTYEPYPGVRGTDTFSYQVIDQSGAKAVGTAKVIIGNTRIMALGDIITAGSAGESGQGYRAMLRNALIKDGYAVEFVGSLSDSPDKHEGHTGAEVTTDYVAARVASWLMDNPADVILLHIGSQDFAAGGDAAVSEAQLENILAAVKVVNPLATVLLAKIIDQFPANPEVSAFNEHIARKAGAKAVIIVDQHSALSYPEDLAGALLPDTDGYSKMASTWRTALDDVLDRCP